MELPPNAEVMAWSNKTGIEMFRYGDHIMGIQGHPEYTKDILLNLINRLLNRDLIQVKTNLNPVITVFDSPSFNILLIF